MTQSVAIVHCHFEPGGVTQVVQNHVGCLPRETRVILFSGPRVSGLRASVLEITSSVVLPGLEYDAKRIEKSRIVPLIQRGQQLFESIELALQTQGQKPGDCIIHWHNHSLGKNAAAPIAIVKLAEAGWHVLLQIHDFAEDQRPENYLHLIEQSELRESESLDQFLYPTHPNISYAVLTAGDAASLSEFGIASEQIHRIPNSVRLPDANTTDRAMAMRKVSRAFALDADARWVLYPVRGIRRKNVGEFLLICQMLRRRDSRFVGALTLRPETPVEAASYDRWQQVAMEHVPNLVFDAGQHPEVSFTDNLAACHSVVSTSVAEGFGMAFLEPWLAGRRVVARNLPGVTADFVDQNVRLDDLYDATWIPGDHAWIEQMHEEWILQRDRAWMAIPISMRPTSNAAAKESHPHDRIDFARLSPGEQVRVIAKVSCDLDFLDSVIRSNKRLIDAIMGQSDPSIVDHNQHIIATTYSADAQREQLLDAYQFARPSTSTEPPIGNRMIDLIDAAHPFYPCRVEEIPSIAASYPNAK